MNKKGFTLIELLAVIAVLAALALITTPIISIVINKNRDKINLRSAENYVKAADIFYITSRQSKENINIFGRKLNVIDKLDIDGKKADKGEIIIDINGNVTMHVVFDKKCYIKLYNQDVSQIEVTNDLSRCNG